jgi:1-acyl-sn-glycerol-3-phosphate acyltransferase
VADETRTPLREAHAAGGDEPAARDERPLPAAPDLRDFLPGVETERQVDDWGRSERISGWFDRWLVDFYYHVWFRTEVEGLEHVPTDGSALLVSNHSGALPPDAMMIMKAVQETHGRDVRVLVEHFFKGYPGFSMLLPKIGAVPAHPANVQRLLYDEGRLVLVFPEGRKGTEKLYKDRYRLRRFGRGGFVEAAMRARAPIVPIALVGAEEAMPVFAQIKPLARLTGLIYAPLTPLLPPTMYLPAKFFIRFLEPVRTDRMGDEPWEDKALVQTVAHDIRATIQEELYDMVGRRRSVWLG